MKVLLSLLAALALTGCSLRTQVVRIHTADARVNPQSGPLIAVHEVTDSRAAADLALFPADDKNYAISAIRRGAVKINVVLSKSSTVAQKTHTIIVEALREMGFVTVPHCPPAATCAVLEPTIREFKTSIRAIPFAPRMLADISTSVQLTTHNKTLHFSVTGHGSNVYQVLSIANWEIALNRATKDFVANFKQAMIANYQAPQVPEK